MTESTKNNLQKTQEILSEAFQKYSRPLFAASYGKNSVVMLHVAKELFGKVPAPVMSIDTGFWFPEVIELMHQLRMEWDLEIIRITRYHPEAKEVPPSDIFDTEELKIKPMNWLIKGYSADAVISAVRKDGNPTREKTQFFEPRDDHMRVNAVLEWSEDDLWDYIHEYNVPYCSLYDQGYRSLGDWPFTQKAENGGDERSGRDQDKEKVMERLRKLGYF